jgi:hypothetical protein
MGELMPRVRITRDCVVFPNEVSTVLYKSGFEGLAPDAHIETIVAGGNGERLSNRGEDLPRDLAPAPAEPVDETGREVDVGA